MSKYHAVIADEPERAAHALEAARTGAAVAVDRFRGTLAVETKSSRTDLVTETDRRAQRAVLEVIERQFPDEPIVAEEGANDWALPDEGPCWVVDPIDGTSNFVRGLRHFGTAVACLVDGKLAGAATVLPALGDTYQLDPDGVRRNGEPIGTSDVGDPETATVCPTLWWARAVEGSPTTAVIRRCGDVRRFGCAQAELAAVADGSLEAAVADVKAAPWDTLAGVGMIRAAGGRVTDLEGEFWRHDSHGLVASNGSIHDALLAAIP